MHDLMVTTTPSITTTANASVCLNMLVSQKRPWAVSWMLLVIWWLIISLWQWCLNSRRTPTLSTSKSSTFCRSGASDCHCYSVLRVLILLQT